MRNEKILVVEFEENSLNTLLQTLQTEGFQVVTAKDGHEGLLMFESENPDLVILEPMLLKLHGFDLCRKITKDSKRSAPVIITTGFYKGDHYKTEAMETFGASAFFEKPYDNEDLLTTIHDLLGNGTSEIVKEMKKSPPTKKAPSIDIEESVREMERSIKELDIFPAGEDQNSTAATHKASQETRTSDVDEMLQDALSDFGLNIDKKADEKKGKRIEIKEEAKQEKPPVIKEEVVEKAVKQEKEPQAETPIEEKDLKTEELIEELIQKEEKIEENEKTEVVVETDDENAEVIAGEEQVEEKIEPGEEIGQKDTGEAAGQPEQKIFEDYFEEPEKPAPSKNIFGFFAKIRKSLPLMIGSSVFVVLVAAGATYYFLKPNKPQTAPETKKTQSMSEAERSPSAFGNLDYSSSPATEDDGSQGETQGPALEGAEGNPAGDVDPDSNPVEPENVPESTAEFMSTTGLSSGQRQVLLQESAPQPESRQFEVIEEQEAGEEKLAQSGVEVSSPELKAAVQNIIQSENTSDRIKTGDLVPIESVDTLPVATKKPSPKYPPTAFQQGIEATVVFRALISEFGNVLDVVFMNPSQTAPAFKKACEDAVRQWRFTPAQKGGVNVKVWKTFSIAFKKNKTE